MNLLCQKATYADLSRLASDNRHSILLEGPPGSGKTYLAAEYAKLLGVDNFSQVSPDVSSIRSAIYQCGQTSVPIVLCFENLDTGVAAASYTLLKFLEEPYSHVYIVVTCRNMYKVPDTIISRSACVSVAPPTDEDIQVYASAKDSERYQSLKSSDLWQCVRTFEDVDTVLSLSPGQIEYIRSLSNLLQFTDCVSDIVWKISHYSSDNSETPITYVLQYISRCSNSLHIQRSAIECVRDLKLGRLGSHAVLSKFVFECKYKE